MKAIQVSLPEKVFLAICGLAWRLLKAFDPHRFQQYFASKINIRGAAMDEVYSLKEGDARDGICRLNNNRMKADGVAKRGDLIKIYNPQNGKFVMRYAAGAGEHRIRYNAIGIDYNAKLELEVSDQSDVHLEVMKANAADREYYLMYQDQSPSSRQSRALGWYIFLGGLILGLLSNLSGLAISLVPVAF